MTCKVKNNGAFLHIPKTGGTWVYHVLRDAGITGEPIGMEHNWGHHERWAFTVVRNPVDWWISLWRNECDRGWPGFHAEHPLFPLNDIGGLPFREYISAAVARHPGFLGELYELYVPQCKYVLQTDALVQQLMELADIEDWPMPDISRPRINASKAQVDLDAIDLDAIARAEPKAMHIWLSAGIQPPITY